MHVTILRKIVFFWDCVHVGEGKSKVMLIYLRYDEYRGGHLKTVIKAKLKQFYIKLLKTAEIKFILEPQRKLLN